MTAKKPYERVIGIRRVQSKDFPLGRHLGTSNSNPYGCPVHVRSTEWHKHKIDVFEHGVRFPCGCIVDLPPMHDGRGSECMVCNPYKILDLERARKKRAA